jgi:outer membrane protein OmpA-like peptidoglycan-associated protein
MTTLRAVLALLPIACLAQEGSPPYQSFKILDLKFNVTDTGGKVEDLRVKETATEVRIEMSADILFDFDKAVIKPQAEAALTNAAALILNRSVRVEGHTDSKGSDAYNQKLSLQRAEAVRTWLAQKGGVDRARITAAGLGARNPVAPNTAADGSDNPEGRQRNRRVELIIAK